MAIISEYFFPSSDGKTLIHVNQWTPVGQEIVGVVQIAHGVAEYGARYAPFAQYLCGRGFAVVAAQIRELADQSAKAAVDTRKLIEGSIKEVEQGNQAAERASGAIESVVDGIKQIANFSKSLKIMVEDQAEAMRQAEMGVNKISEVIQSNAATAEEASATSQELSAQSVILDELIGQFVLQTEG